MEPSLDRPGLSRSAPPGFQEAWLMVLGQLQSEMRRGDFESWVKPLQPLSFKEGIFRLGAHNAYCRDWVESHLRTKIHNLLEMQLGRRVSLQIGLVYETERGAGPGEAAASTSAPTSVEAGASVNVTASGHSAAPALTAAPVQAALGDAVADRSPAGSARLAGLERAFDAEPTPAPDLPLENPGPPGGKNGKRTKAPAPQAAASAPDSPRKIQLQRAYGTQRARVIQPERGMFLTLYFFNNWLPLLGHSAMTTVIAARSLCYWNPLTGELRNVVETDMSELAARAAVSVRTVKDVLNHPLVKRYFLRYKVRRIMTPNGVRTAGIVLQVRMDDPLTPEDQDAHHLEEEERWYTADFEDEGEE